ncbi:hypothetical protein [Azospirillum sp. sgz302134]
MKFFRPASLIMAALGASLLGACQSMIVGEGPPLVRAVASEQDLQGAEYMARFLLAPGERAVLLARHDGAEARRSGSGPSGVATVAGVTGAAALGQNPLSPGGVGAATLLEGSLRLLDGLTAPDAAPDRTTLINLPKDALGSAQPTPRAAKAAVQHYILGQLQAFARRVNRSVECVDACEGNIPTYRLSRIGSPLPYRDPEHLYVTLVFGRILEAPADARRDAILGFPAAWSTPSPRDFVLCVDHNPPTKRGDSAVRPCKEQFLHPLERELLRCLTADGYVTYASRWAFSRIVAVKGRLFALAGEGRSGERLVDYEIAPETDRPYLPPL